MDGYKRVFDLAEKKFEEVDDYNKLFTSFRSQHQIYGFIDNGDKPQDTEADSIARNIGIELYEKYKKVLGTRKQCGYEKSSSVNASYTNLDSRHIMMSVFLFSNIKESLNTIVEIGGGFGNWLTLNQIQSFKKWTIIDLPHLSFLQQWYLDEQNIDKSIYEIIPTNVYDNWVSKNEPIDLVIGSHSVSEFSFDIFYNYFLNTISKSKYFFYCYHNTRPTPELIKTKINIIEKQFTLVTSILSENRNVTNALYINKNYVVETSVFA